MRILLTDCSTRWTLPASMILSLLLAALAACTPNPNEAFIQGSWYYNDAHIQEVVGESFAETFWTFDRGTYETHSCCFMDYRQYGRYDVVESEGDTIILELFHINGKLNSERVQIEVKIDREADTIKLLRAGPFERMLP